MKPNCFGSALYFAGIRLRDSYARTILDEPIEKTIPQLKPVKSPKPGDIAVNVYDDGVIKTIFHSGFVVSTNPLTIKHRDGPNGKIRQEAIDEFLQNCHNSKLIYYRRKQ